MYGLGQQHAAAVAPFRATARLVVVTLRPPVIDAGGGRNELPKPALRQKLEQGAAGGTIAVLEDDAKPDGVFAAYGNNCCGARETDVERLFKNDVLAGAGCRGDELEMRIGRCQDEDEPDRAILKDSIGVVDYGDTVPLGKGGAPCGRRTVGGDNLNAIAQGAQRLRVWFGGHTQPDDADADRFGHASNASMAPSRLRPV